jgi:hypothetical protein
MDSRHALGDAAGTSNDTELEKLKKHLQFIQVALPAWTADTPWGCRSLGALFTSYTLCTPHSLHPLHSLHPSLFAPLALFAPLTLCTPCTPGMDRRHALGHGRCCSGSLSALYTPYTPYAGRCCSGSLHPIHSLRRPMLQWLLTPHTFPTPADAAVAAYTPYTPYAGRCCSGSLHPLHSSRRPGLCCRQALGAE